MTNIGDILYVRVGRISSDLDGCPCIVAEKHGSVFRIRYQIAGALTHDWWNAAEADISRYFEQR